jgi:ribonuclease HI
MTSENRSSIVYTDGSCPGNPGPIGGLGVYIPTLGQALSWRIEDKDMTNNRAELLAAILALIVDDASSIDIHTDSEYVSKNSVENLERWHKNNYMGVANQDLWRVLYSLIYESNRFVYMTHVRRGSCTGNVISDALAQGASADDETYVWEYRVDLNRWLERNSKQRATLTRQSTLKINKVSAPAKKVEKKKTGSLGF